tara:strand:+ start:374 stop:544 length:171 start_codon:yes stop_codon:yes gene_type:complete
MNQSFLEYTKAILIKVSFDSRLFRKEFGKALRVLNEPEKDELIAWAKKLKLSNDLR